MHAEHQRSLQLQEYACLPVQPCPSLSLHATQCWNTRYPCTGNVCVAVSHAHMILPCLHCLGSEVHAVQASSRVPLSTFLEFAALCNAGHGLLVQGPVILPPSSESLPPSSLLS